MKLHQVALSLIAAGILGASGAAAYRYEHSVVPVAGTVAATSSVPTAPEERTVLPDFRSIVERYGPAVVNVNTEGMMKTEMQSPLDDPFFQFFRGLPLPRPPAELPVHGQGSGFIVSSDGVILTNAHVVRDASEVTVKLVDRREFRAKVLGSDPVTDVAVLKIDATHLPTVQFGNPANVQPGDWVLAIGSPFGFENSVSKSRSSRPGMPCTRGSG